ncbi:MAG: hypothetical protein BWK79_01750 [Beggiatoa sp. IS2]|nr:MAG: hypothetical protein BWK79_01750 [Beggiatoa sp. IS2]
MEQQTALNNLQLELLKLYSNGISEQQLFEIKLLLARYFAEKATEAMDKIWDEQDLTAETMVEWSHEHCRIKSCS